MSFAMALGLAVAGLGAGLMPGAAAAQAAAPAAVESPVAPVGDAAKPANATATKPATTAAAAAPATSTDPMLAVDGAPGMTPQTGVGQSDASRIDFEPQVTPNGVRAKNFHDHILLPMTIIISVFVLILLLYVIVKFRAGANPVPSKTSHNTLLEVIWTGVPVLILAAIAAPSIGLLSAQYKPAPKNAVTLKAIGNQWYWSYQYPDNGGFELTANMLKEKDEVTGSERARTDADGPRLLATDQRVVLPINTPIRLITTANDVIHSWSIPAFWVKLDAVPGRLNETSFTITKPGVYFGQCSELCGQRHGAMPITVEAVEPAVFARWVKAKGGTMPGEATAAATVPPLPTPVTGNAAATAAAGPVENAIITPPTSNQGATANPAGAGTGQ